MPERETAHFKLANHCLPHVVRTVVRAIFFVYRKGNVELFCQKLFGAKNDVFLAISKCSQKLNFLTIWKSISKTDVFLKSFDISIYTYKRFEGGILGD